VARELGVPVLILKRPALPAVDRAFESQADMAAALDLHQHISQAR
jgi:precorrin-6A/cobalt-precorrin-6A reductase